MRGLRAKALMRMVRWERGAELKVVERDLVVDKRGVVRHSPDSIRMLYLQVKRAFTATVRKIGARVQFDRTLSDDAIARAAARANGRKIAAGLAGEPLQLAIKSKVKVHERKRRDPAKARKSTCIRDTSMHIAKPLRVISDRCPPTEIRNQAGQVVDYKPHPTLAYARRLADAGNGQAVRAIAQSLLAA